MTWVVLFIEVGMLEEEVWGRDEVNIRPVECEGLWDTHIFLGWVIKSGA